MIDEGYAPFVLVDEARRWVADCVDDPEHVDGASDERVMRYVRDHYEGGVIAFAADTYALHGFGTLAATLRN
jgi:hypothetical protein